MSVIDKQKNRIGVRDVGDRLIRGTQEFIVVRFKGSAPRWNLAPHTGVPLPLGESVGISLGAVINHFT
jgi:hypothetical protein